MQKLSQLPSIEVLELGSGVNDAAVQHLCRLRRLRSLEIRSNEISDKGLADLASLPSLRQLDITWSDVSIEAVARFRHERPDVELIEDAWHTEEFNARIRQFESGADLHESSGDDSVERAAQRRIERPNCLDRI
jgi:hypothetical protein